MIELKNITKTFLTKDNTIEALKDVSLTIKDGEIYGIIGMSGAGKSTLVRCINGLEKPSSGEVIVNGIDINKLSQKELNAFRKDVSMIFQNFNLLMQSTCLSNVMFPLELMHMPKAQAKDRAIELLEMVGLKDKLNSYPSKLSGGQQQRVAIARALASNPKVLLCDEATSALDPNTTNQILDLIREINKQLNITVVIITHQMSVVESICNRVAILDDGEVAEEGQVSSVFSNPKSLAAKRLVFPEIETSNEIITSSNQKLIRVVFDGAKSASSPLIASLAIDKGVAANIVYASLKNIKDKTYGSLLLGLESKKDIDIAIEYLSNVKGVKAKEFNL